MIRSSTRFVTVIALLLFAKRAGAQLDSNAIAHIYCGSVSSGCIIDVKCYDDTGLIHPDQFQSFNVAVKFDSTVRLADTSQFPGPSFLIDTSTQRIVDLTFRNAEIFNGCEGGLILTFAPIPFYYDNETLKIIPSRYVCGLSTWGFCQYGVSETCTGSCNDSTSIMDSLYFSISPARAAVAESPTNTFFQEATENGEEVFYFNSTSFERKLQVSNILGVTICNTVILSGQTQNEEQLPLGLYFARLGDQVTKFVVPPR